MEFQWALKSLYEIFSSGTGYAKPKINKIFLPVLIEVSCCRCVETQSPSARKFQNAFNYSRMQHAHPLNTNSCIQFLIYISCFPVHLRRYSVVSDQRRRNSTTNQMLPSYFIYKKELSGNMNIYILIFQRSENGPFGNKVCMKAFWYMFFIQNYT